MEESELPKRKSTPKPTSGISQKVWKGDEEVEHSLFQLLPTVGKRNDSYQAFKPIIKHYKHSHFYHSVDKKGKELIYCTPMGGHFHKIIPLWEGDTLKSVECGPPLLFKWRKDRSGYAKKNLESILYKGEAEDGRQDIPDMHKHDVKYLRSQMIKTQHGPNTSTQMLFAGQKKYSDQAIEIAKQVIKDQ